MNGRSRASIEDDMKARIERRDWMAEQHAAIKVGRPQSERKEQLIDLSRQCVILLETEHERPV